MNPLELILKQQDELTKAQAEILQRLIDTYGTLYSRLLPRIRVLELLIDDDPDILPSMLEKNKDYKDLLDAILNEVDDFAIYSKVELTPAVNMAIGLGISHTNDFFTNLGIEPNTVSSAVLNIVNNLLAEDGKLIKRIELWAPNAAQQVSNAILGGVKLGRNPRIIASDIQKAFGVGLSDALRTTRTAQLYAYREATRAGYIANSNIVKGWIWDATLDERTCMSCLAMHGSIHGLEEILNDHHCGRCGMLPYIPGVNYGLQNAEEWFNSLSDAKKIAQMGKGRYEAYKAGKFTFDKLSKVMDNEVYGPMRVETPLKELV